MPPPAFGPTTIPTAPPANRPTGRLPVLSGATRPGWNPVLPTQEVEEPPVVPVPRPREQPVPFRAPQAPYVVPPFEMPGDRRPRPPQTPPVPIPFHLAPGSPQQGQDIRGDVLQLIFLAAVSRGLFGVLPKAAVPATKGTLAYQLGRVAMPVAGAGVHHGVWTYSRPFWALSPVLPPPLGFAPRELFHLPDELPWNLFERWEEHGGHAIHALDLQGALDELFEAQKDRAWSRRPPILPRFRAGPEPQVEPIRDP